MKLDVPFNAPVPSTGSARFGVPDGEDRRADAFKSP
jgi:hypothetical protein